MAKLQYPTEKIKENADYYAFELLADDSGHAIIGSQTMWVGWADVESRVELRKPSLVHADRMASHWVKFQMPFHVVNGVTDFLPWFQHGGHALVKKSVAKSLLLDNLNPDPCVRTGTRGFTALSVLPSTVFRPAPTPKQRMSIIKRDNYRCKICGRNPEDHVDIELHVHHIRPHGQGGPTHEDNLITLCDTCHCGLDPHDECSLYSLLEETTEDIVSHERKKYLKSVQDYQKINQIFLDNFFGYSNS